MRAQQAALVTMEVTSIKPPAVQGTALWLHKLLCCLEKGPQSLCQPVHCRLWVRASPWGALTMV